MAIKYKVMILCPALVPLPSTCCSKALSCMLLQTHAQSSQLLYWTAPNYNSLAAQNLNATQPLHYDSGVSLNKDCTIQQ